VVSVRASIALPDKRGGKVHSTDTPLTQEQSQALDAARELVVAGMPVFLAPACTPDCPLPDHDGQGWHIPRGWPDTPLDPPWRAIDMWRPGDALAAVCGHTLDALDVDPRNGGDVTAVALREAGLIPHVYAAAATPSGGAHWFVAALGEHKDNSGRLGQGVDYQGGAPDGSGRGFVFIAPTVRPSQVDGVPRPYVWLRRPDAAVIREGIDGDDSGAALADMLRRERPVRAVGRASVPHPRFATATRRYTMAEAEAYVWPRVQAFAEQGYDQANYNARLNDLAVMLGHFVPHFLSRQAAEESLYDAAAACGCVAAPPGYRYRAMGERGVRATIASGLDRGQVEPYQLDDPGGPGKGDADPNGPADVATWVPADLGAVLDGTHEPEVASLMPREDGVCLLYAGRVHSFHGESESGKSMLAQLECARVLRTGGRATYIDFESDAVTVVTRLLAMQVPPTQLKTHFSYIRPDAPPSDAIEREPFEALMSAPCDLAIIDGVTEAMGVFGTVEKSTENDQVALWLRRFPRQLAVRTGAAVVLVDHVTKNADTRGRFAIGGQQKMNGLDGTAYVIEVRKPLGRGMTGAVSMRIGKDRPGSIRPHCGVWRASDRTQEATYVVISSGPDGGDIRAQFRQPRADVPALGQLMEAVSIYLEGQPEPASQNQIVNAVTGKEKEIRYAANALAEQGFVEIARGPNSALLHKSLAPYRMPKDDSDG